MFKVGDRVRRVECECELKIGGIYTVSAVNNYNTKCIGVVEYPEFGIGFDSQYFELVERKDEMTKTPVKTKTQWIAVGGENLEICDSEQEAKLAVEDYIKEGWDNEDCTVYEVVRQLKRKVIWE